MKPRSVGIIGGYGRMGRLFARVFAEAGIPFDLLDIRKDEISPECAARHDVLLLAVPLDATEDVCKEIGPYTRRDGLVLDIGSLKKEPVELMLQHCRGEVIGLHPMFGPSVSSFEDRIVFMHNARSERWISWVRSFLRDVRAKVVEIDPDRHDRLMAFAQVMRHMLLTAFGRALMKLEFDAEKDTPISGLWFSMLVGMLQRQCMQSSDLYAAIAVNNPDSSEMMDALAESVIEIRDIITAGSKHDLTSLMDEVACYISPPGQTDSPDLFGSVEHACN